MIWILYAFLHSLFYAMSVETGRYSTRDGWVRLFWQAVFSVLLLVTLLPFMQWPSSKWFYVAAVDAGLIMTAGYWMRVILSEQQSGRVSSIYMPAEAIAATIIWLAINPSLFFNMIHDPLTGICVALAFVVATVALILIRPHDISWRTLRLVGPTGLSFAIAAVVTRLVMPLGNMIPTILAFALVNFAIMTVATGLVLIIKKKSGLAMPSAQTCGLGIVTSLFTVASYVAFVAAITLAPNPGYSSFMSMLLPVWMIGLNRIKGQEDRASLVAALLLLISAVSLIVASM